MSELNRGKAIAKWGCVFPRKNLALLLLFWDLWNWKKRWQHQRYWEPCPWLASNIQGANSLGTIHLVSWDGPGSKWKGESIQASLEQKQHWVWCIRAAPSCLTSTGTYQYCMLWRKIRSTIRLSWHASCKSCLSYALRRVSVEEDLLGAAKSSTMCTLRFVPFVARGASHCLLDTYNSIWPASSRKFLRSLQGAAWYQFHCWYASLRPQGNTRGCWLVQSSEGILQEADNTVISKSRTRAVSSRMASSSSCHEDSHKTNLCYENRNSLCQPLEHHKVLRFRVLKPTCVLQIHKSILIHRKVGHVPGRSRYWEHVEHLSRMHFWSRLRVKHGSDTTLCPLQDGGMRRARICAWIGWL